MTQQICPRRVLEFGPWSSKPEPIDRWDSREQFANGLVALHCSHCGSLHPDVLMAGLRDRTLHLGGSDKSYKWYVQRALTDAEKADVRAALERGPYGQVIREMAAEQGADPQIALDEYWAGPQGEAAWAHPRSVSKFYTPHLSRAQCEEFMQMWRDGKLSHSMYVRPWLPALADDAPDWLVRA